ncbi:MAG: site-2 protease family protein, partial [Planctomycetaceae bacterium]
MTSPENEQEDKEDVVSHPDLRAGQRDFASEQLTSQGDTSLAGSAGAGEFHTVEELQQRLGVAGRTISQLQRSLYETSEQRITSERRRQRKKCTRLFILTFLSTFLVGAQFFPLEYVLGLLVPRYGQFVNVMMGGRLDEVAWQTAIAGISYAVPVMGILLFHEMGHYLQAVRYRVPASLPYFIPMPLPPMGTMGAVIFQGQGTA